MVRGLPDEAINATLEDREIEGTADDDAAMDALIEDVLEKIHVAKAFNSNHQMLLAEKAKELASEHEDSEYPRPAALYRLADRSLPRGVRRPR